MLRKNSQEHHLALICDPATHLCRCIADGNNFLAQHNEEFPLSRLLHESELPRYSGFLHNAVKEGFAFCDSLLVAQDNTAYRFSLFCISRQNHLFIIAAQSPQHLFLLYDEFMLMINEQARMLREAQKNIAASPLHAETTLREMMQLNNELSNMQRELALKNRQLREQEERFRKLVTNTPDAQLVLAEDNTILFLNPAAADMLDLCNEVEHALHCPFAFEDQKEFCFKRRLSEVCVEVRCNPVLWDGNKALLVSLRDITERKRIEQIKDDIQRMSKHDLISPLNSLINIPALLAEEDNLRPDQIELLSLLSKAGMRMMHMVRLSLDLYKMEEGTYSFTPELVDLTDVFGDILTDLSRTILSKNVKVLLYTNGCPLLADTRFPVLAESPLCYSMFANLVLNAIEASDHDTTVRIDMDNNVHSAAIRIHNCQCVPESIKNRFFEKYVSAGKKNGTGLGTYSARLIARTLGGSIHMRSSTEEGTTITVSLPL